MSAAAPLVPQSSFDVATTVMSPANLREKFANHDIPVFDEAQKTANAREVAFGIDTGTTKELALEMLSTGVPVPGIAQASALMGVPFMFWARDFNAQREMQQLTEQYRDVIAEKTNLEPDQVDERVLLRYATQNESLAAAVKAIAHKRESHIANTTGAVGGMLGGTAAAGALFAAGTVAWPIALAAGLVGGFGGYEVGESFMKYLTNSGDAKNPSAVLDAMQQKREDGKMISAEDVFALRVAQSEALQEAISAKQGDDFHALGADAKREVMASMPAMLEQSMKDAACCNLPAANLRYLMLGEMPDPAANVNAAPSYANQPTKWVNQVAANVNAAPSQGGFAARELERRAAATEHTLDV